MPRVKRTPTEEMRCLVRAAINHHTTYKGLTNPQIIKMMGMSESAFYKKKQRPETFTLGELWDLSKIFGCPVEDLTKGII